MQDANFTEWLAFKTGSGGYGDRGGDLATLDDVITGVEALVEKAKLLHHGPVLEAPEAQPKQDEASDEQGSEVGMGDGSRDSADTASSDEEEKPPFGAAKLKLTSQLQPFKLSGVGFSTQVGPRK